MAQVICNDFPISNEEYLELDEKFSRLCHYASWQLIRKNSRNNHTDDFEDINQNLIISLMKAGSYHKRQVYINKCFVVAQKHVKDHFIIKILAGLQELWNNKTKHGAHKQKFGEIQEYLLDRIVKKCVPKSEHPQKNAPLEIDDVFTNYCKAIIWNENKSMGRKITKERPIRGHLANLENVII